MPINFLNFVSNAFSSVSDIIYKLFSSGDTYSDIFFPFFAFFIIGWYITSIYPVLLLANCLLKFASISDFSGVIVYFLGPIEAAALN